MAITRKALTAIKNLSRKKDRDESGLFTAEGIKVVEDLLLAGFQPQKLLTTEDFIPDSELFSGVREVIDPKEMERISALDSSFIGTTGALYILPTGASSFSLSPSSPRED